jgi:hypothetical protein
VKCFTCLTVMFALSLSAGILLFIDMMGHGIGASKQLKEVFPECGSQCHESLSCEKNRKGVIRKDWSFFMPEVWASGPGSSA